MYDFKNLSDYDFEILTKDLLEKYLSLHLESFKKGRDNGIDLRYSKDRLNETIIQCKHYANSSYSNLKSNLIKSEIDKIKQLNPKRYILVTSLGFTPMQKDELLTILNPYCKNTADIIGNDELNGFLRKYPEIEKNHYKLWLTSSTVLDKILHNDIYYRSEITKEKILKTIKLYVTNKSFNIAKDILDKNNYCIISGIPGIGKTTLAEILLISYLNQGFEIIKITQNIKEAFDIIKPKKKQVFYYDDFLGKIGLDLKLAKNEDEDIFSFIEHVKSGKSHKFILTTREYILNQAKETYESFARQSFASTKCIINLADYTKHDKAKILYNHIYFSNLSNEYVNNLLDNDILKIVNHKNFSPRIIEVLTSLLLPIDPKDFFHSIIDNLDNPAEIWSKAFGHQISKEAQDLLFLLISLPNNTSIETAKEAYHYYHSLKSNFYNYTFSTSDFSKAIKELDANFITIDNLKINFHNPSINDFLSKFIYDNDIEFRFLCENSISFEQLINLYNLSRYQNHILVNKYKKEFTESILDNFYSKLSYPIFALHYFYGNGLAGRICYLLEINTELKSTVINDFILNFLENLKYNFKVYDLTLNDYNKMLKYFIKKKQNSLISKDVIASILDYAIDRIVNNKIYWLEDLKIFSTIEKYYPELMTEDIIKSTAVFFEDTKDEIVNNIDFGSIENIDDCIKDIEFLADYFNVDSSDTIECLEDKKVQYLNEDEDEDKQYHNNSKLFEHQISDSAIKSMFESLRK